MALLKVMMLLLSSSSQVLNIARIQTFISGWMDHSLPWLYLLFGLVVGMLPSYGGLIPRGGPQICRPQRFLIQLGSEKTGGGAKKKFGEHKLSLK